MITRVKTPEEIEAMRQAGRRLATVLERLRQEIEQGMTTRDLAELAKAELARLGGQPSFLGYQGFPDVICISVNDEVVHGIPRQDVVLKDGDVVGLDFGVTYHEMITDGAITVIVGQDDDPQKRQLVRDTEQAMMAGIKAVKAGCRVGDIGAAIEKSLRDKSYGIVRDLVGHGVGHELHEDPNVPNYGQKGTGMMLQAGMTIAIEPMLTLGGDAVVTAGDNWTVKTRDGSLAAHFENTVLVTKTGAEILTKV